MSYNRNSDEALGKNLSVYPQQASAPIAEAAKVYYTQSNIGRAKHVVNFPRVKNHAYPYRAASAVYPQRWHP